MSVRTLIENIGQEKLIENFNQTEKSLKEIISGEIGANLFEQLIEKYSIDFDYFSDLMMLLSLFVSKSINTQEFVNEVSVFVPQKYFSQFLQELEDKLWSPYDVYLNKAGVVYKQLTKLMPAPIQQTTDNQQPTTEEKSLQPVIIEPALKPEAGAQPAVVPEIKAPPQPTQQITGNLQQEAKTVAAPAELPKTLESIQQTTDNLSAIGGSATDRQPTTEIDTKQQKTGRAAIPELVIASKPVIISDISVPGEKRVVEIPKPISGSVFARPPADSGAARVKFDAPRVGPQIFKPTESEIMQKVSGVKFVGPEAIPEALRGVLTKQEEKKVEIPKPPEVKKTEVAGRQVIDLTNFGLAKPDED